MINNTCFAVVLNRFCSCEAINHFYHTCSRVSTFPSLDGILSQEFFITNSVVAIIDMFVVNTKLMFFSLKRRK